MGGRERTGGDERDERREGSGGGESAAVSVSLFFSLKSNHKSHTHKKNRVFFLPRFCLFSFFAGWPQREEDILLTCLMIYFWAINVLKS